MKRYNSLVTVACAAALLSLMPTVSQAKKPWIKDVIKGGYKFVKGADELAGGAADALQSGVRQADELGSAAAKADPPPPPPKPAGLAKNADAPPPAAGLADDVAGAATKNGIYQPFPPALVAAVANSDALAKAAADTAPKIVDDLAAAANDAPKLIYGKLLPELPIQADDVVVMSARALEAVGEKVAKPKVISEYTRLPDLSKGLIHYGDGLGAGLRKSGGALGDLSGRSDDVIRVLPAADMPDPLVPVKTAKKFTKGQKVLIGTGVTGLVVTGGAATVAILYGTYKPVTDGIDDAIADAKKTFAPEPSDPTDDTGEAMDAPPPETANP